MDGSAPAVTGLCPELGRGWRKVDAGAWQGFMAGEAEALDALLRLLPADGSAPSPASLDGLAGVDGFFALALESPGAVVAAVDRSRSYPLFFTGEGDGFRLSNSARSLRQAAGLAEADPLSVLEMAMAGYVTGPDTVFRGLSQAQAGEALVLDRVDGLIRTRRYYAYDSDPDPQAREDDLMDALAVATDAVCARTLELAAGRPVWVPLSGGLDSRLLLCKFAQMGCPGLQAFSYGPAGNYEARVAREVAERLGTPWFFAPTGRVQARAWFHSSARRDFWNFSDGLCSLPFMQDAQVLQELRATGRMPADAMLVNGQSGDFITGGHLPKSLAQNEGGTDLMDYLLHKHFSLWTHLARPENRARVQAKARKLLGLAPDARLDASAYERWEWQERQCKYVVNGQRAYDFFGLAWDLPLWRAPYYDFWQRVPVRFKLGQGLYKSYLRRYDYKGLFREFDPKVWRWPGWTMAVPVAAQAVGLVAGRPCKDRFYKYCSYFGHYSDKYAAYPFREFAVEIARAKNVVSLFTRTWIAENGLEFPV